MSQALKNLLASLNLEKIEEGLFRGQSEGLGLRQVFGGQVVGRVLYAAKETVPGGRPAYLSHSYFLRLGDSGRPIIYDVETLHDSNNFSTRRVATVQNSKPIFYMTAFFQAPETGFEHQKTMSPTPAPNGLPLETQIARSLAHLLPPVLKDKFICGRSLEVHPMEFHNPLKGHVTESHRQVRIRVDGSMPDDLRVHQYLLGCVSDLNFLPVALQPHGIGFLEPGIQITAIDHSTWFYRPFNLNEWLLYSVGNTSAFSARGFARGEFYTQDGVLVTSIVQGGVIRNHD